MNPNQAKRRRLAKKLGLPTKATWKEIREAMHNAISSCSICYEKTEVIVSCPRSSKPCKEGSVCGECATKWRKCPVCKAPHPHPRDSSPTGPDSTQTETPVERERENVNERRRWIVEGLSSMFGDEHEDYVTHIQESSQRQPRPLFWDWVHWLYKKMIF